MSNLFIIRHAESKANKNRIMASRLPYPLTKDGKDEADIIAKDLKNIINIDKIITSPLLRATQTADSFEKVYNIKYIIDERITEQDLGKYSGMTYDEVKNEPNYVMDSLKRWDWIPEEGGESYSMIANRIKDFFESLEVTDKNILIVTHAVSFRLIRAVLEKTLPIYPKEFPNNGEIWKVKYTGITHHHNIESIFLGNSKTFIHNP